uniref:Uncharacterized protein n=1 Tax=Rhizophora mucronata TaxID=61149 RepID=A0A2P2N9W4_RHIMU
MYCIGVFHNK